MTSIALIDHGAGNLVSIERALRRVGATPRRITRGQDLSGFDGVVLPGVGATGAAMRTLSRQGLVEPLVGYRGPLLGVCVGMQLLFDHSDEDGNPCLGILEGTVRSLRAHPLPHMGWNDVEHQTEPLFGGIGGRGPFYFVHSYVVEPADETVVAGRTIYGDDNFVSVVRSGLVTGVQFHPERSAGDGLALLGNFVRACGDLRHVA